MVASYVMLAPSNHMLIHDLGELSRTLQCVLGMALERQRVIDAF